MRDYVDSFSIVTFLLQLSVKQDFSTEPKHKSQHFNLLLFGIIFLSSMCFIFCGIWLYVARIYKPKTQTNENRNGSMSMQVNLINGKDKSDYPLKNNCKIEFQKWVPFPQYLSNFEKYLMDDINAIPYLDINTLRSYGITDKVHLQIFEQKILEFKEKIRKFYKWLRNFGRPFEDNLDLINYKTFLQSIGILTIDSFKEILTKHKNNPNIFISNDALHGFPEYILEQIFVSLR